MKIKLLLLPLLSVVLANSAAVFAQTSNGAEPSASTDVGNSSSYDTFSRQGRSGDYLLGQVVVADGDRPWDPIVVNVTCDGQIRYTAATDPKGHFVIASVHAKGYSPGDAADPKSKLAAQFVGCDVSAALAGFDSSVLKIMNRSVIDNPDIGTITLKSEAGSVGTSSTSQSAPKDAAKAFDKARAEWQDQKLEPAQHDLEKAVKAYPQFAEAWYELGIIQERANSPDAWNSFSKAAAADPKFLPPYEHLAASAIQTGKWEDAATNSAHALQLNPHGSPHIWYYNALANYKLDKKDIAETSATKALQLDPLHTEPNTEQLLAVMLAQKHDYPGALQHLRNCLTYLPSGPNADTVRQQITQLEKVVPATSPH